MVKFTFYRTLLFACFILGATNAFSQFGFTDSNTLLSAASHSGVAVSVVDINNDGLDDIVKMDQSTTLVIDMQNMDGSFTHYNLGNITGTCGTNCRVWGMSVADVDHNGWKDVATGVRNAMYLVKLSWTGSTIAAATTTLGGSYFVQNVTFGDFNNDGWIDLAVCDDVDYMKIYKNTAGTLNLETPATSMINTNINGSANYSGDPYDSGNYGSVWLDFDNDGDLDLYIAHCRQSTSSSTDQRRRDRLFVNNGSNVYTEAAATYGIEVTDYKQTWTTSFGDIDNDGDLDVVMTNHGENGQILENNGSGHFTDITSTTGFTTDVDPMESVLEDFDNDGFLDIFICGSVGGGPGSPYLMYHNNGNKTFTQVTSLFSSNPMLSFAVGDLNHDGKVDIFSSYGNVYNTPSSLDDILYLNTVNNSNHFITFNLTGTISNHNAIGARVTIYGAFGKQIREVRAGETYGTSNSMQLHFGLGAGTTIDSARIDWPAGGTTHFNSLAADQFVTAVEGGCTITGNTLPPAVLCTGQTVNLTAQSGYTSYLWSTAATTQSISVSSPGNYSVKVTSGACSNISPSAIIQQNPDQTPTITSTGTNSCQGVYTLTTTPAVGYSWTGPSGFTASTQSIQPAVSGTYSLTIQGNCANFSAAPVAVNILAAPSSPTVTGASGTGPASFNLSASGTGGGLTWYDAASGGSVLATGTSYTTPVINSTTTYYVEDATTYPGTIKSGGLKYHSGASTYSATTINGGLNFDVLSACTLKSVKVYSLTAATRQIQVENAAGTVIDSLLINIPADTSVVNLNFALATGTGYRLTTKDSVNYANFTYASPALRRTTGSVNLYPLNITGVLRINNSWTGSAISTLAYYYFYDWKVESGATVCKSPRVPVTATVTGTGINEINKDNIAFVYPNPAADNFTISLNKTVTGVVQVSVVDLAGRVVSQNNFNANDKLEVNVSGLAKGTYLVKVLTENAQSVQRVVKN